MVELNMKNVYHAEPHYLYVSLMVGSAVLLNAKGLDGHKKYLINNMRKRKKLPIICKNCDNIKEVNEGHAYRQKYCSLKCQQEYKYKIYIDDWKKGRADGGSLYKVSNYVKRYLLEKCDNKCCLCGWSEVNKYTNRIPLEVDHINGDPSDHKERNLRIVCPNCHSLTKYYKARGKKGIRVWRKNKALQ